LADAAGFFAFPGCETTPFPELLEELPTRERRSFYTDLETLVFEVSTRINAVESL
jgi:hypothetical protein